MCLALVGRFFATFSWKTCCAVFRDQKQQKRIPSDVIHQFFTNGSEMHFASDNWRHHRTHDAEEWSCTNVNSLKYYRVAYCNTLFMCFESSSFHFSSMIFTNTMSGLKSNQFNWNFFMFLLSIIVLASFVQSRFGGNFMGHLITTNPIFF